MIDVNFDFTSDTPEYWDGYWDRVDGMGDCGKYDPDYSSPTLLKNSQILWSRRLPNGEHMKLERPGKHGYFTWRDMNFSCDSITASFHYWGYQWMIKQVYQALPDYKQTVESFVRRSYTMPE